MSQLNEPVPYFDVTRQFAGFEARWLDAIREIGRAGSFILGPHVQAFEREFAEATGAAGAVAVANGTDALVLALRAFDIGRGDEVITTPFTFFASAEAINLVGATPVFADVRREDFNLDPDSVSQCVGRATRALLPVHIFGAPADMPAFNEIAGRDGLVVIEDAAQAYGASQEGKLAGSLGDAGCFSFYPTKVLGCYGDGGMITVRDEGTAARVRHLRNHCASVPFRHDGIGYNSRLDEIQAALLRLKLPAVGEAIERRRRIASRYASRLEGSAVTVPAPMAGAGHVYNLYTVRVPGRDRVVAALKEAGIGVAVCYPEPLHLQQVYREFGYSRGDLPVAEQLCDEVLSLPVYPELTDAQVDRVCEVLLDAVANG